MEKKFVVINNTRFKLKYSMHEISTKITQFAREIKEDYKDTLSPPIFLWVLNGGAFLGVDLARVLERISFWHEISTVSLSRYIGDEQGGEPKILSPLSERLSNRHIIVVEDCIEQGDTLNFLNDKLKKINPKPLSIAYCTLFLKNNHHKLNFNIKYLGWEIGNPWIVGEGLDSQQFGRGLLGVYEKE